MRRTSKQAVEKKENPMERGERIKKGQESMEN